MRLFFVIYLFLHHSIEIFSPFHVYIYYIIKTPGGPYRSLVIFGQSFNFKSDRFLKLKCF